LQDPRGLCDSCGGDEGDEGEARGSLNSSYEAASPTAAVHRLGVERLRQGKDEAAQKESAQRNLLPEMKIPSFGRGEQSGACR
jgi:hypothetical protein